MVARVSILIEDKNLCNNFFSVWKPGWPWSLIDSLNGSSEYPFVTPVIHSAKILVESKWYRALWLKLFQLFLFLKFTNSTIPLFDARFLGLHGSCVHSHSYHSDIHELFLLRKNHQAAFLRSQNRTQHHRRHRTGRKQTGDNDYE